MRLALITHRFATGDGQGRVNYEIAKAALDAGHTVWLIGSEIAPELAAHPGARPVRIGVAGWPSALLRNQVFALKTTLWLARHRARLDLVHANGFVTWARTDVSSSHFVHAAWLRSRYHTVRLRKDWYGLYQWLYTFAGSLLERHSYRRAALVVAVSQQVRRELLEAGVDAARVRVIANGVDLEEFSPRQTARESLGLPPGRLMLFVGDIKTPRKNLDTLLRALANVAGGTLLVVGGTAGSPYPKLAADLGVAARVRFLGYRRDVAKLMRAADLFVFPSRYEACSLVLLEAAASGLPVVAAKTAGGVELLDAGCSVLVDDPDDAAELAAVLNRLLQSPDTLAHMGAAARATAEAHSWTDMAARYLCAYGDLAAARARAVSGTPRCEAS